MRNGSDPNVFWDDYFEAAFYNWGKRSINDRGVHDANATIYAGHGFLKDYRYYPCFTAADRDYAKGIVDELLQH